MEFCIECGSRLINTKKGLECPKCRKIICMVPSRRLRKESGKGNSSDIYVSTQDKNKYPRVSSKCPRCGNLEAFRWFSGVSGEHAGIRRERTMEHLKCTKCAFLWTRET
jgi:DNA-directed RNA polymerase subunit M/transcription elongation factor TFIIS